MNIMHWEYSQLTDHLRDRDDLWSSPRENLWLRTAEDNTAQIGLAFSPPANSGPFRQYGVKAVPFAWTVTECDEYLRSLLCKWTSYGTRTLYTKFLIDEVQLDSAKAQGVAIALCSLDEIGEPDAERHAPPTARSLFPDVDPPDILPLGERGLARSFAIVGGGWIRLALRSGMLHITASLPSHGIAGGGYDSGLTGFVRPRDGNTRLCAAALFGVTSPVIPQEGELNDGQRNLPPADSEQAAV